MDKSWEALKIGHRIRVARESKCLNTTTMCFNAKQVMDRPTYPRCPGCPMFVQRRKWCDAIYQGPDPANRKFESVPWISFTDATSPDKIQGVPRYFVQSIYTPGDKVMSHRKTNRNHKSA